MRSFTLAQLRTKVRERADMVNSQFITDAELNGYISASYAKLYDILVKGGLMNYELIQTINTDGTVDANGFASFQLPQDYYGTLGVDYQYDNQHWISIPLAEFTERNRFGNAVPARAIGYRVIGAGQNNTNGFGKIILLPAPPTGQVYRHIYVQAPVDLTLDSDVVDGVSGWEELIVIDAAIKCLTKEESDTAHLERERTMEMERIEEAKENRMMQPHRVSDVFKDEDPFYSYRDRWWT